MPKNLHQIIQIYFDYMDSVEKSFGHQNYEFFKEWHLFNMTFGLLHPDNLTINTIGCISENEHGKSFGFFRFTRIYIFSLNAPYFK